MVAAVALILSVVTLGAAEPAPASVGRKVSRFQKEVFDKRDVRVPYAVVSVAALAERNVLHLFERASDYARTVGPQLREYFADPLARDAFREEEKWGYPFLYLRSRGDFEPALSVARRAAHVRAQIAHLVDQDPDLARVSVHRSGERHFSVAFEIAPGLLAYSDIDHFRVRTQVIARVLPGTAHGERVVEDHALAGFYEDTLLCEVVVPLVVERDYVADLEFTFYK